MPKSWASFMDIPSYIGCIMYDALFKVNSQYQTLPAQRHLYSRAHCALPKCRLLPTSCLSWCCPAPINFSQWKFPSKNRTANLYNTTSIENFGKFANVSKNFLLSNTELWQNCLKSRWIQAKSNTLSVHADSK